MRDGVDSAYFRKRLELHRKKLAGCQQTLRPWNWTDRPWAGYPA